MPRRRIVHVIDTCHGGVGELALQYCELLTKHMDQLVLMSPRANEPQDNVGRFESLVETVVAPSLMDLGKLVSSSHVVLAGDLVHAHSSRPGFITRVGIGSRRPPIVYSPHGFPFNRLDVPPLARTAMRGIERLLRRRTAVLMAVGADEVELALELGYDRGRIVQVAHPMTSADWEPFRRRQYSDLDVICVGRIGPAKGAQMAADVGILCSSSGFRFTWVGDGDSAGRKRLTDAGFDVTGWLQKLEVERRLRAADVLLLPSAWEGFPLVAIEALAAGIPVVGRNIPALCRQGLSPLFDKASDACEILVMMADSEEFRGRVYREQTKKARSGPPASEALLKAYATASDL